MNNYIDLVFSSENHGPEQIALVDNNGTRQTTWRELEEKARRVAAYSKKKHLSGLVPVMMTRSSEYAMSLMGLAMSGIAVAPLSDHTPDARVRNIEEQTGRKTFTMKDFQEAMKEKPMKGGAKPFAEDAPAYVIFTSGSTGTPKGVMLPNRAIEDAILRSGEAFFVNYDKNSRVLQRSSFAFIALMIDLFAPLYKGASVYFLPEEYLQDNKMTAAFMNQHAVTGTFFPPKLLASLEEVPSLKRIAAGGEALRNIPALPYELVNVWGMSELAGIASCYPIPGACDRPPIGKLYPSFHAYVLDENGREAEEGELCISGPVAIGYYKRPDLTREVFVKNLFSHEKGHEILFHTGDMVRRLPDGNLSYLSRKDFMIKINGQRVEPGEAEAVLRLLPGISDCAVKGFTEENGRSYLAAYYVSTEAVPANVLEEAMREKLPSYLVPSYFVSLEKLPLNANGKLDRGALPAPAITGTDTDHSDAETEQEKLLCRAFEEVLSLPHVGPGDDFLRLGGDSILAMTAATIAGLPGLSGSEILSGRTAEEICRRLFEKNGDPYGDLPEGLSSAPLTDSQMGIYLECAEKPESVMYNIPLHLSFERKMLRDHLLSRAEKVNDAPAFCGKELLQYLKKCLDQVLSLHPALYSKIGVDKEQILMKRMPFPEGGICETEASSAGEEGVETEIRSFIRPFDLTSAPLCRAKAVLTGEKIHLLFDFHHIIADGTSLALLMREFTDAIAGKAIPAETLDPFKLYDAEKRLQAADPEKEPYFERLLAGVEIDSSLLPDHRPEEGGILPSSALRFRLSGLDLSPLKKLGITESSFFMGVFGYTLAKMTGQSASLFSAGENGRKSRLLSRAVSMMVRTLPVVMNIDESQSSFALLTKLQEQFFTSVSHDSISYGELCRAYGIHPEVSFVYQSEMLSDFNCPLGRVAVSLPEVGETFSSLHASVLKSGQDYSLEITFRADLYDRGTIERFAKVYAMVSEGFSRNSILEKIALLPEKDLRFLNELNRTESPYDASETIVDIFRRVARENPDKTALVSESRSYTYREADDLTDRLAAFLRNVGVRKGETVSVLIPRNEYMYLASMGVMKAGAVYQPLDPSYPAERLSFMQKDAQSVLLIADRKLLALLPDFSGNVLYTDDISSLPAGELNLDGPGPDDGYVLLYTSGTTGTPKGCLLAHRNLTALVHNYVRITEMTENTRAGAYASYGFDAHMADIYPPILLGGTIYMIPEDVRLDLPALKDFIENNELTHLIMTTQLFHQFITRYQQVKSLKCLLAGGEKMAAMDLNTSYIRINGYGPSECTVMTSYFTVDRNYDDIPIGKALPNTRFYVADPYGRRLPVGAPGELLISGHQVGLCYLNREEQTRKTFIPNVMEPSVIPGYERCYRTGDIVRFLEDGNLTFIGRRDSQVKIRGFRIELSEVERIIRSYPGITEAVVIARDAASGGKCLHAYIVSEKKVNIEDLNNYIRADKPPYMVPAATMQIPSVPLTVNGKVDKRKLPEPVISDENLEEPETECQKTIFRLAASVVGTEAFGIHTDLFLAGLSSLSSIQLCSLLSDEFHIPVQIRHLKKYNTVAELEVFVEKSLDPLKLREQAVGEAEGTVMVSYGPDHPITKTMEGIYAECTARPDSTFYQIPYLVRLSSEIDAGRLKEALAKAVEAHPGMKTELFVNADGQVRQHRRERDVFAAQDILEVTWDDLAENSGNASLEEELRKRINEQIRPMKLNDAALFEITLIHAGHLYLLLNFHHIIADGTSVRLFMADVEKAYSGEILTEETYSGFEAAEDEKMLRSGDDLREAKEYYTELLEGLDKDFLPLPDRRSDLPLSSGKLLLEEKHAKGEAVRNYCKEHRLSVNAFLVGAFGFLLSRYSGTEYAVFNTVYNGRNDSRTRNTFAMLVKTLPVVCHTKQSSVLEMLNLQSAELLNSMANDLYSFAEISRELGVRNDIMFIYQGESVRNKTFAGFPLEEIPLDLSDVKMPLSLQVTLTEGKLLYELEFDNTRYTEGLVRAFLAAFDQVLAEFVKKDRPEEISLLSPETEEKMEKYNDTSFSYDRSETITGLFLKKAGECPDHLCVSYLDRMYTFSEVLKLTGKTARFLMEKDIGRGDVVPILIPRNEYMVITAHGVLRSGACYVGLDPTYPADRLDFMIKDGGARLLIADRKLMDRVPGYTGEVLYTDEIEGLPELTEELEMAFQRDEKHRVIPESDAFIVYSSGTTGLPKGSVLRHRNIVCFYHNYRRDFLLNEDARVATYASFGFDGGAMDVFCCPMSGAALYVIPDEIRLDLALLEQFYVKNGITSGFMTTQVGSMFIGNTRCRTLRVFTVGGEKLIPTKAPDWVRFYNGYGPSETMCYVNLYRVKNTDALQPIGPVNGNMKEYIVDAFGNRLPFGALGELCISGGQTGRGYLNRPEKTREVFVENPFSEDPDYRIMYRSGDIVRILPDGNVDFVGRRDGQVKIRGFRIELSEVEQQIRKFPGVENVVVAAFDHPAGGKFLAAYLVMEGTLDPEELKAFIRKEKPDYMVPQALCQLPQIPLTSNGKVAMSKLPKPELSSGKTGAEPSDETEEKICAIFGEVLGLSHVYADDDFFMIGGSSISAIQVTVKCEQAGFNMVYKNLFANPTAQKLSAFLRGDVSEEIYAKDLETGDGFDYSALKNNIPENLKFIKEGELGDVLLTGATGFLGSHVFRELLNTTDSHVICIVRRKGEMDAETRLNMMMIYYFEDWYSEELHKRVTVVDGDLEDEETLTELRDLSFDTIINCAANVKHFAAGDTLLQANFSGVEHLIALAVEKNVKLIQISSLSVCGESVNGSVPKEKRFRETDLNIGQSLENRYIYSKYLAEQALIDKISRGEIRGKVIRLGNLMAREDDSEFQVNAGNSGFLRIFLGFARVGAFPVGMMDTPIEFSPIDYTAKAVVLLSGTPDIFTVFHCFNCNSIHYSYFLKAIQDAGRPIEVVEDDVFEARLRQALKTADDMDELGGLLSYRNSVKSSAADIAGAANEESRRKIPFDNEFTTRALYRLGFYWPLVSETYLRRMVEALIDKNLFSE